MEEGLIEIDPEMFITCRLCFDEKGKFQIMPKLREKIKYVFDIDVLLFDGFSQVMCEKCKLVVNEFCELKEKFKKKQKQMQEKVKVRDVIPESTHIESKETTKKDSSERLLIEIDPSDSARNKPKKAKKRRIVSSSPEEKYRHESKKNEKTPVVSTSSDEEHRPKPEKIPVVYSSSDEENRLVPSNSPIIQNVEQENAPEMAVTDKIITEDKSKDEESKDYINVVKETWHDVYKRNYICRYCNKQLTYKNSIRDHVRRHDMLMKTRRMLTRWHSTVALNKFDDTPNLTGDSSIVVINPTKFISDFQSPDYYVLYTQKCLTTDPKKQFTCEDLTSEDDDVKRPKLRKRIRVKSYISDECAELHSDTNNDSSSEKTYANTNLQKTTCTRLKSSDFNTIKKIVSASIENMSKKQKVNTGTSKIKSTEREVSLRRKFLSFGRKTMGKTGYVSMGLLKFLEQKNLKIRWTNPKSCDGKQLLSKDSNYVRIQTRIVEDNHINNLSGFQPCLCRDFNSASTTHELFSHESVADTRALLKYDNPRLKSDVVQRNKILVEGLVQDVPNFQATLTNDLHTLPITTTLVKTSHVPETFSEDKPTAIQSNPRLLNLLNASPVLNPKQSFKKKVQCVTSNVIKDEENHTSNQTTEHNYVGEPICLDSDTEEPTASIMTITSNNNIPKGLPLIANVTGMCLPIITSTESLAPSVKPVPAAKNEDPSFPRIKCKPVSELMATKLQNETNLTTETIATLPALNEFKTDQPLLEVIPMSTNLKTKEVPQNSSKNIPSGCVILHTLSLPNTLTNRPFEYLDRLLQMHGLALVDDNVVSVNQFKNLVKFRLGVHQHPFSVMLSLTLDVHLDRFRIVVRNKNNEEVKSSDMLALWQWEILKAFNSESVVKKIKQAAQTEPKIEIKHVNLFTTLLGSITLVSDGSK